MLISDDKLVVKTIWFNYGEVLPMQVGKTIMLNMEGMLRLTRLVTAVLLVMLMAGKGLPSL